MGFPVGRIVGIELGSVVGLTVGSPVGWPVGNVVDGIAVGIRVGAIVGNKHMGYSIGTFCGSMLIVILSEAACKSHKLDGIVPVSEFCCILRSLKFKAALNFPSSDGMVPPKQFLCNCRNRIDFKSPKLFGILLEKLLALTPK